MGAVHVIGFDLTGAETLEAARTVKPRKESLPLPGPDWRIVEFADGARLCVHLSRLRFPASE